MQIRNKCYDWGIFKTKSYPIATIGVGNLSLGGTGKSPLVMDLIDLFYEKYCVATLSRGYGRKTKGYILANPVTTMPEIGDEPMQFYKRFAPKIAVAVCENRQEGIAKLLENTATNLVILDDVFQHRAVKLGYYIMLTTYENPFYEDYVIPTGYLREWRNGAQRADWIVVTKCPSTITSAIKEKIIQKISLYSSASVVFSTIVYDEYLYQEGKPILKLTEIIPKDTVAFAGIAKPHNFFKHLEKYVQQIFKFPDHYNYTPKDIEKWKHYKQIITTEKDYMRLQDEKTLNKKLYYLPIKITFDNPLFKNSIEEYVRRF